MMNKVGKINTTVILLEKISLTISRITMKIKVRSVTK